MTGTFVAGAIRFREMTSHNNLSILEFMGRKEDRYTARYQLSFTVNLQNGCHFRINVLNKYNSLAIRSFIVFNPLNPELNPICYLLALLGAYHFLHVSRIRVKLLTLRLLMSYIYGAPILDVSRSHTTTQHSR